MCAAACGPARGAEPLPVRRALLAGGARCAVAPGYEALTRDFTGDGRPDVLVVDGGASASSVSLLRRNEGTGFTKVAGPAIGAGANYGTVADFTGDGLPDVAISSFFGESANVLLNQGNSTFAHGLGSVDPTGIPMGHRSTAIATADFDGDTDLDLAVANWDGASISTRLRSAGGFTTGPTAAAGAPGSAPRYIVAGKFNDDSDPDLLVSNFNDGTVSILLGAAGATFSQPQGSPVDIGTAAGASVLGRFQRGWPSGPCGRQPRAGQRQHLAGPGRRQRSSKVWAARSPSATGRSASPPATSTATAGSTSP